MPRERSDVQSLRATSSFQRDMTARRVGAAVEARYGGCSSRLMRMVEEKGRQRQKDPRSSSSGVPAKRGLGELDHGQEGQRGLLPPGSQDLATWGGMDGPIVQL